MDGNCEDICEYSEGNVPDNMGRKYERKLIDAVVESICGCVEDGDSETHLQVIKTLVTVISTFSCHAHDNTLLDGFRACYRIHLQTSNTTNQTVSKVALHQMMSILFQKMEAFAGNRGVGVNVINQTLKNDLESRTTHA
jgi:hypothetical protein